MERRQVLDALAVDPDRRADDADRAKRCGGGDHGKRGESPGGPGRGGRHRHPWRLGRRALRRDRLLNVRPTRAGNRAGERGQQRGQKKQKIHGRSGMMTAPT